MVEFRMTQSSSDGAQEAMQECVDIAMQYDDCGGEFIAQKIRDRILSIQPATTTATEDEIDRLRAALKDAEDRADLYANSRPVVEAARALDHETILLLADRCDRLRDGNFTHGSLTAALRDCSIMLRAALSGSVAQTSPDALSDLISAKANDPAFAEIAKAWPRREVRFLPVIKMAPCAVSDWYVLLPSGKQIILGSQDWEASTVPSTEGK